MGLKWVKMEVNYGFADTVLFVWGGCWIGGRVGWVVKIELIYLLDGLLTMVSGAD